MSSLENLKSKWFIDVNKKGQFPPYERYSETSVAPYTDGNNLSPLIDGSNLMKEFHDQIEMVKKAENPSDYELWIAGLGLQKVKLLGKSDPNPDVQERLLELASLGVTVYFNGSGHMGMGHTASSFGEKLKKHGSFGFADPRSPRYKGQHQKFTILKGPNNHWLATLGSQDLFIKNWDTPEHLENSDERLQGTPVHNVSVKIEGPAIHDIAATFAERWNDRNTWHLTKPKTTKRINTDFLEKKINKAGPHSVQVLRTYGYDPEGKSYSFAKEGEFTVWASYINAIKRARNYIYIEDQYLYPFGYPPYIERDKGIGRDSDIIYQLGEAIKRGVDVVTLVPGRNDAIQKGYEIQQRLRGANYLEKISKADKKHGKFVFTKLRVGKKDPVIHSKVMLVDDELSLIGSTNIGQVSMCTISEIHVAVIDEKNEFTTNLRLELWKEHMELSATHRIKEYKAGIEMFYENAKKGKKRLRLLNTKRLKSEKYYGLIWDKFCDPYFGPKRD